MSDELGFNKIAAAALATGLLIAGLAVMPSIVFPYKPPAKQGYAVAVQADTSSAAAPADLPIDWGSALASADVAAGKIVATKCQSCHNLEQGGPNMTGPNLWGVLGRPPGTHAGFAYSDGMKAFGAKQPIWDFAHVNAFITAPGQYIEGTKMTFIGLKQRQDRINVIAYLHTLGSTLPIPAPAPAAAAPAAPVAAGASPKGAASSAKPAGPGVQASAATAAAPAGK
jgi:cytochrome c